MTRIWQLLLKRNQKGETTETAESKQTIGFKEHDKKEKGGRVGISFIQKMPPPSTLIPGISN